ncbi:FAD-dependent oxidoreductase [Gammaproteobacteria bacterium]|nr:FAD-dependent oxidoreductase [Gammaproteobacteria bacterium]
MQKNIAIIGAGFYGLYIGGILLKNGHNVEIYESEDREGRRASYINQARIHRGYHYQRSILTASRSSVLADRFEKDFSDAVIKINHKYCVASNFSKVSGKDFQKLATFLGIKCNKSYIDNASSKIDSVFDVEENVFDSKTLISIVRDRYLNNGGKIHFNTRVNKVAEKLNKVMLELDDSKVVYDEVFNVSYESINVINKNSDLPLLPLKSRLSEICLIKKPKNLDHAITVVDGPFFSIMPFGNSPLWSLTHVLYTHKSHFIDCEDQILISKSMNEPDRRGFEYMSRDIKSFFPELDLDYVKSIYVPKIILSNMEKTDSRPILYRKNYCINNYHCLMGGKIDNIYDIEKMI